MAAYIYDVVMPFSATLMPWQLYIARLCAGYEEGEDSGGRSDSSNEDNAGRRKDGPSRLPDKVYATSSIPRQMVSQLRFPVHCGSC